MLKLIMTFSFLVACCAQPIMGADGQAESKKRHSTSKKPRQFTLLADQNIPTYKLRVLFRCNTKSLVTEDTITHPVHDIPAKYHKIPSLLVTDVYAELPNNSAETVSNGKAKKNSTARLHLDFEQLVSLVGNQSYVYLKQNEDHEPELEIIGKPFTAEEFTDRILS